MGSTSLPELAVFGTRAGKSAAKYALNIKFKVNKELFIPYITEYKAIFEQKGKEGAFEIIENIQLKKLDTLQLIYSALREELISRLLILNTNESEIDVLPYKPWVILIVGVNGSGKTTTLGRLAHKYQLQDKTVIAAAGDTFRAAAIDQLQSWAKELNFDVVAHQHLSLIHI